MVRTIDLTESMAQAGILPMTPTASQFRRGSLTPATHTLEQMTHGYQTLNVLPIGVIQHIIVAQPKVRPAMTADELKRMDRFQKLFPAYISGAPSEDA